MYLRLTERCNMRCPHCCVSATGKGADMSLDVFIDGLRIAVDYGMWVTIGGGEPTLHPQFKMMIDKAYDFLRTEFCGDGGILVITNGTRYRNSMHLIKLMEQASEWEYNFHVIMSDPYDGFHEPSKVNWRVYDYFKARQDSQNRKPIYQGREEFIRNVAQGVVAQGRALQNNLGEKDGCACESVTAHPDGTITACGCVDAPVIGHTRDRSIDLYEHPPKDFVHGGCWRVNEKFFEKEECHE